MDYMRISIGLGLAAGLTCCSVPMFADAFPIILRGKVTMQDGTPPPKSVGIERICSDNTGSAPGPITNKEGAFIWRMDVDPFKPRTCFVRATFAGHESTTVDISALNGVEKNVELATIVLREKVANPYALINSGFPIPGKSKDAWNSGMKAADAGDVNGAIRQLKAAVEATPKFAQGWLTLGILQDNIASYAEAKSAFEKAVEADPKLYAAQVALAGTCNKLKDWACAAKAAEDYQKADGKHTFPVANLYLAAARLGLKDYAGAEAAANEALRGRMMRAEYALARIAAEKGDVAAAKDHLEKYIKADPNSRDANTLKAYAQALGQPQANALAPEI